MKPALVAAILCALAGPAVGAEPAAVLAQPVQSETMVLRVRLNTVDKGDLFVARTPAQDFLVRLEDLKAMGFRDPSGTSVLVDGEPHLSLKSMRGVRFEFQERGLILNITAEPQLLPASTYGNDHQRRGRGAVPADSSLFVNYALSASGGSAAPHGLAFSGELGWRWGDWLLLSDGSTVARPNGRREFVRLMSSVTRDDRDDLRRTVVGDFFTPAREFSTGVNLGGIGLSKLYGINPYFVQFPTQSVSGNVALPSDLEVYLDGQRIRSERLRPGEFEVRDILAYGGARNVQLVLRDAFGRVQQVNYSFYFSDQPLRAGLHEYSYNLGALRRSYGIESHRYGPPAFALFHRYGFSNALTLGLRAEGTREFANAGPMVTAVLGSAGVINLSLAGSTIAGRQGGAASLSYNYQARSFSFGAWLRADSRGYAALGDPPSTTNRRLEGNLVASYYLPQRGGVSLSHSLLSTRSGVTSSRATPARPYSVVALENRRTTALSYSTPLVSGRASLTASLSHIKDRQFGSRNEAFVGVIVFLDKAHSVAANVRADRDRHSESVQLTRNQPIGEGLGYVLSADRSSGPGGTGLQLKSNLQYNAPAAILRAELGRHTGLGPSVDDYRLSVAGGVAYVQGNVGFGRPITDSFGIVKVGELADVAVSVNGQPIGRTNAQGKVFVPTLTPYFDNDVSIAPESVPIDYAIPATVKTVSPSLRSGAVIDFAVAKIQAFSGKLKSGPPGRLQPVEFQEIAFSVKGKAQVLQTGRGGEFYVENLPPGRYPATATADGKPCLFDLQIPASQETFVDLGDVVCRPR